MARAHNPPNNGHTTWQLLSASSKEWWNVKDTLKTLPGDATNPAAFKVGTRSPLRDLPTGDATKYIRIDPAHTFAIDGVGKDFLASCIIMMIRAGHFGNGSVPHCFQNAYASFLAYCNAYNKNTSITEFGYNTFKLPQNTLNKYPRGLGKGYDAAVVGAWLVQEVNIINLDSADDDFKDILSVIRYTASASDRFWRTLYRYGVWIPRKVGTKLVNDGWQMTDGYGALATLSSRKGFYGFQIRPKFHMLGHIVRDLMIQLEDEQVEFLLNPCVHMTWSDEDFIGRVRPHLFPWQSLEPGPPKELVADVQQTYRWLWVGAVEKGLDWVGLDWIGLECCKITVKSKIVEVTGKHGSLKRDFKHLPIELFLSDGGKKVVARMYFAKSKQCSMLNTVCSHISNLFEGVTKKFEYKMRLVYAHFPINVNIINGGKTIEIRNFLGEKVVRTVHMLPGATVDKSSSTKDEIVVTSADIELAGRSAALIHQSCLCKKKDIRKFLDGIYVSSHGVIQDMWDGKFLRDNPSHFVPWHCSPRTEQSQTSKNQRSLRERAPLPR
ncbi:unnamed protein product [Cladocopium goreaui]|uniref:Large ribosomal subunit protein uL6 (60S ribosomal protein L9) n=1 Tax=Cladocopium goreaui TaxID=2562237 RepID=A0A9P1BSK5_9DINO|nr:unnamed protein product [Cladocopium goreaui]